MFNPELFKVKAKRIDNGEWVEGWYYPVRHEGHEHWVVDWFSGIHMEVNPDTICRCIGKIEKNKRQIFNGDFLQKDCAVYIVVWDEENCLYYGDLEPGEDYADYETTMSPPEKHPDTIEPYEFEDYEVVGNIHDKD